jgi:hypothetical protein
MSMLALLAVESARPRVLLAGADAAQRRTLLRELTDTLPGDTLYNEAQAVGEVLEHAPRSRMVMLTGDLDDASAESLTQLLGHRYPELPVVNLDVPVSGARPCEALPACL